jgi:ketosteroid isomerase-like protein
LAIILGIQDRQKGRYFMRQSRVALTMAAAFFSACAPEPRPSAEATQSSEADRKAIETVREQALEAFNSGDIEAYIELLTDDVVYDPPNRPAVVGKEAMRAYGALFEKFILDTTYPVDELVIEGDWAFDRGVWVEKRTPREGGEQIEIPFGLLQIYYRDTEGSWKLARMVANTDTPPSH